MDRSKDTIVPTPVVSAQATRYASAKSTRSVSYTSQLLDVIEEAEHALLEQRRGALVVAGQAVVSEQVSVARIQEQLRPLYRLVELAGGFEVFVRRQRPFVGVHDVDLERDALRPRAAELRRRDATVEQQGSLRTGPCLGQHLRRHRAQREPGIDDLVRQAVRGHSTALDDRVEADLLRVLHAVGELREGLAVVEIREVHDVSGSPELVGERQASGRQSPVHDGRAEPQPCGGSVGLPLPSGLVLGAVLVAQQPRRRQVRRKRVQRERGCGGSRAWCYGTRLRPNGVSGAGLLVVLARRTRSPARAAHTPASRRRSPPATLAW